MSERQQRASNRHVNVSRSKNRTRAGLLALVAAGTVVGLGGTANAVDTIWNIPGTGAWETGSNWSTGNVPGGGDVAIINNGGTSTVSTFSGSVDKLRVGAAGTGTLSMTDSASITSGSIFIGGDDGPTNGTGTLNLGGSALLSSAIGTQLHVGYAGVGNVNMTGGVLRTDLAEMYFGSQPGASFNVVQSGGAVETGSHMRLGYGGAAAPVSNYTLNGGSITTAGYILTGGSAPVVFTVNNGTITTGGNLHVGDGFTGTMNINGGTINTPWMLVGNVAAGTVNMDGGTVTAGIFTLGQNGAVNGFPNTVGVMNHTGGTLNVTANVIMAELSTGANLYDLNGGTLNLANTSGSNITFRVGAQGTATFKIRHADSVANIGRNLIVGGSQGGAGAATNSFGTLEVSAGTLNVGTGTAGDGILALGNVAPANVTISGGTINADVVWTGYGASSSSVNSNGRGQVTQTGGTVNATAVGGAGGGDINIGRATNHDNFWEITGGSINVADELTVAQFSTDPGLNASPNTAMQSNGRLTIDGTASVVVGGRLSSSLGSVGAAPPVTTPPQPPNPNEGKIIPGGTGLIEVKGGTLTAASFLNGRPSDEITGLSGKSVPGPGSASYVQTGGTATLGHVSGFGTVAVSGGAMNVNSLRQSAATISGTGTVTVAPDSTAAGTSNVGTLAITNNAKLDLGNNKLVTNTPVGTFSGPPGTGTYDGVQGMVQRAYNFGAWDQPGLTTSMPNAGQNAGPLSNTETIAVATAAQVLFIEPTDTAVFQGQTVTGATTIAMYTYAGDLNMDGLIDGADYGVIDNSVQFPGTNGYANGDFNFDGVIDGADYGIIDNAIQFQGAPFPGVVFGAAASSAGGVAGVTAVPEPASIGVMALAAAAGTLARRRPRRTK